MILDFILDLISMAFLIGISSGIFYVVLTYFKGMSKPPFWIYFIFGFVVVAFHGFLQVVPEISDQKLILSFIRLAGYGIMLGGVVHLIKSYTSMIKFDKKIKKKER